MDPIRRVRAYGLEVSVWRRRTQAQRSVWPVVVVMVNVHAQDVLELPAACNQKPVETVAADGADPALGDRVRLRRPKGCADDFHALVRNTSSKVRLNLLSRSWIKKRIGLGRSGSDQASWRACCVVQGPSGFAVQPATCTRRLPSSMKNST